MSADLFFLKGQVALVTGSTRGIGRATAEIMAARGAKVVISGRKQEACDEAAKAIADTGGEAAAIACNIFKKPEVEALVQKTLERFGRIDCLICNAAGNPAFGPLAKVGDEAFDRLMGVNVKSNLWLCNLVIPSMAEHGGGAVVIVSSVAGLRARANLGGYGMSKAANHALARNLALEWGPNNVRVNAIAPGVIRTDFSKGMWEDKERLAQREQTIPLRRIGLPEEIGAIAAFLASPAGRYITGQIIVADGGATIN